MSSRPLRRLRARLAFPLLCAISAVAGMTPMLTAPHEANACSGAGQSFTHESAPKIENGEATERDLIVALPAILQTFGVTGSSAVGARIEKADGTEVTLSRNDFAKVGPLGNYRKILVPTTALDAHADYVLVVDGVLPGTDPQAPVQTVRVPFKTGDKLHPDTPTPVVTGEISRSLDDNLPQGSICCGRSSDYMPGGGCSGPGKGTPDTCATTHRYANEVVKVGWEMGAPSNAWGSSVVFSAQFEDASAAGKPSSSQSLTFPPIGLAGNPFGLAVAAGAKGCVTITAHDLDTGIEKISSKTCFDASPNIPATRTSCEDLIPLVTSAKSKSGCLLKAELSELLKDCPGAPGAAGSGGSGDGGSGAGGAAAGGSGGGGSAAGGSSAGGSSALGGSGGGIAAPSAAPSSDGGCAFGTIARSDHTATLAPIFAALAGVWVARRRQARGGFVK